MAVVRENDGTSDGLTGALLLAKSSQPATASDTLVTYQFPGVASYNPYSRFTDIVLNGTGFTFDATGLLAGGTITSIAFTYGLLTALHDPSATLFPANEAYSQFALSVPSMLAMIAAGQAYLLPSIILAGNDTIAAGPSVVNGYDGDDVISLYPDTGIGITASTVNGGGGVNTVVFPTSLLSQVTAVYGGGGNERVVLPTYSAQLTSVSTMQFIDGSVYETNAAPGAQAALMFKGIFGRLPDAINAGGYAHLAQQSGTFAAGDAMLATQEGQAATSGLSDAAYINRLYQTILGRTPEASAVTGLQASLASGSTRGSIAAQMAASAEAQSVNYQLFATRQVFAADPNAVDVLRAYEVLLNRTPEAAALINDVAGLANGTSLATLYSGIQASNEFAADGRNGYGITAGTPAASVYAIAHSDSVTALIQPLVTVKGVAVHA